MSAGRTIALSLGVCLGAGVLAGPAAAATAPVQAAAVSKIAPRLASKISAGRITYGSTVRITAAYTEPNGKPVTGGHVGLQALRNGKWQTWQAKNLPASGVVTFDARPLSGVTLRWLYSGTSKYNPVNGKNVSIAVTNSGTKILAEAKKHTGALYLYGAAGPKRFDCSGFTLYVYKAAAGRKLPHKANSQQKYGTGISKSAKKPGDLIVFRSGSYGYHVGVYAGGNYMYDSPHSGARVAKRKMFGSNYVVRRLV